MTNGVGPFLGSILSGMVVDSFTENGVKDWRSIWLTFAAYALVLGIVFPLALPLPARRQSAGERAALNESLDGALDSAVRHAKGNLPLGDACLGHIHGTTVANGLIADMAALALLANAGFIPLMNCEAGHSGDHCRPAPVVWSVCLWHRVLPIS